MRHVVFCAVLMTCGLVCAADSKPQPQKPVEATLTVRVLNPLSVSGGDDVVRLRHLASGVGWEFSPTSRTTEGLKHIGIKTIRCINVDLPGEFSKDGQYVIKAPNYLLANLATCREVGARPHVVIAVSPPEALRLTEQDLPAAERGVLGSQLKTNVFGPTDWARFRNYCKAFFQYVLITQGFADAEFEVGNEPDTGGTIVPRPPKPPMGSAALYAAYFEWYRNVAQAAVEFEREHASQKVCLGGPALAWPFTFHFGAFNWASRFMRDCTERKVKLDFVGVHYYGNLTSLDGQYPSIYPSFTAMLADTRRARDQYCPGTPICMTEWGPSYHTNNSPTARVNANHLGAAWSAAFLNTMLAHGVDSSLYLVTTDLAQPNAAGKLENIWGWPALFVNHQVFGEAYPKATYHVFDMVHQLAGQRVAVDGAGGAIGAIAAADDRQHVLRLLLWNFRARLPEGGPAEDLSAETRLSINVADWQRFFAASLPAARVWLVGPGAGDAVGLFDRGQPLTQANTAMKADALTATVEPHGLRVSYTLPHASVCLVQLGGKVN
jgi:xylan 1,4-beta-xylosidase